MPTVVVDAINGDPTDTSGAVKAGDTIRIKLANEPGVQLNATIGSPYLTLSNGAQAVYDATASQAAGVPVFNYVVQAGQDAAAINVTGYAGGVFLYLNVGSIVAVALNHVSGSLNLSVDTVAPTFTGLTVSGDNLIPELSVGHATDYNVQWSFSGGAQPSDRVVVSVNGGPAQTFDPAVASTLRLDGASTITAYAVDAAGNVSGSQTVQVNVREGQFDEVGEIVPDAVVTNQTGAVKDLLAASTKLLVIDYAAMGSAGSEAYAAALNATQATVGDLFNFATVLVSNGTSQAATQADASAWAQAYGLTTDVMTFNGNAAALQAFWEDSGLTTPGQMVVDQATGEIMGYWNSGDAVSKIQAAQAYAETLARTAGLNRVGGATADVIMGSVRADVLDGAGGNDTIDGGMGWDLLRGGYGDDTLFGNDGDDRLEGNLGLDVFYGGKGDDLFYVDAQEQVIELAGQGVDKVMSTVTYALSDWVENLTLTGSGDTNGTGNALDNIISGNGGENVLHGGDGNDTMGGGAGNDQLFGEGGNDGFRAGAGADLYDGGAGIDTVNYSENTAANVFLDGSGRSARSAAGDTYVSIENLIGSATGGDWLVGDGVANRLTGNGGDDKLWGRGGIDQLLGGDGADQLAGGAGADVLLGGAGHDVFIFDVKVERGTDRDRVMDFRPGEDVLQIDASVFGGGLTAGGAVSLVVSDTPRAIGTTGVFLYDTDTGNLSFDVDGVGRESAVTIAWLEGAPSLSQGDFLVVA